MYVGSGRLKTQRNLTQWASVRRSIPKIKPYWFIVGVMVGLALLVSCTIDSGGGGGGNPDAVAGFEVPDELSAIPPAEDAVGLNTSSANLSLRASLKSLARAAADAGTDYSEAKTSKYVEEHTLEQFEIIEQVLQAINQTHYADAENIGIGAYKSIVAWEDEQNGIDVKQLEPWIVISEAIVEDGQDVLRVRAWIEEQEEDEIMMVKAEFKIYEPATKNDDGSYQDYGVWELNVKFDDDAEDFFAASASVGDDGEAVIKLHESCLEDFTDDAVFPAVMKAIMYRSDATGYGKVYHPDWDSLWGPDFDPSDLDELPHLEAIYAYNSNYLAVQDEDEDVQYKDRSDVVEMTHRYGVYDAETGDDVMKTKSFGFPIKYTVNEITRHAYYGAWQGRHQLWTHGEGDAIPEGTEVSREDFGSDEEPETYTVGPTFNGVLVKRTYVDASLDDIKNIPVEIWINQNYSLLYNAGDEKWYHCDDVNWGPVLAAPTCNSTPVDFAEEIGFASLIVEATNHRKHVNINGWDNDLDQNVSFVYAFAADGEVDQDGFYEAEEEIVENMSRMVLKEPVTALNPVNVPQLWIYVGGSIYVEWDGDSWVEKELENFNENTWTPEFGDNDKDYNLPENRELYINMQGVNFVVRKDADGTTVKMELQTAVNPDNVAEIVPDDTIFTDPWNPDTSSTFELITDPEDENYLMLVYLTVSDFDDQEGVRVGDIATNVWGIETTYEGDDEATAFNWEYSETGGWGSVTYLLNSDESFKLLDDPMRFNSIEAENNAGDTKTLALQFDGWMMGLPQMYDELSKSNWTMTDTISDKIINLPTGTALTESDSGDQYLLKPLEISQFLSLVADTTGLDLPDISEAEDVDLDSVPDYVEHGMGDMPDVTVIKYSEGILVE